MFWVWFILLAFSGLIWFRKQIGNWRNNMPMAGLKAFSFIGLIFFLFLGVFGFADRSGSMFWQFVSALLSWAGIISLIELFSRRSYESTSPSASIGKVKTSRFVDQRISQTYTQRRPSSSGQVWPPATQVKQQKPDPLKHFNVANTSKPIDANWLAINLMNPDNHKPVIESPMFQIPISDEPDLQLDEARSALLRVLINRPAFMQEKTDSSIVLESVEPLKKSQTSNTFETKVFPTHQVLPSESRPASIPGVVSRFASSSQSEAEESKPEQQEVNEDTAKEQQVSRSTSESKFTYSPKMVESKFGK